ncbi:hypothetical protein FLP41_11290 [Paracoccus marcusii]|nr:hypothetical protein FLP41_11290 [Paracoccus marcusii]
MHRFCLSTVLALWPVMAPADTARGPAPLQADTLAALRWQARPVVVLGPEAQVARQIADLQAHAEQLAEREVVILTDGSGADALRDGQGSRFCRSARMAGSRCGGPRPSRQRTSCP